MFSKRVRLQFGLQLIRCVRAEQGSRGNSSFHESKGKSDQNIVRRYETTETTPRSLIHNDFSLALRDIVVRGKSGIIPQILQAQRSFMETKQKSRQWMTPLKVLTLKDEPAHESEGTHATQMSSTSYFEHDKIASSNYIALSYVWNNSIHEGRERHSWKVGSRNLTVCKVRDSILDRVVRFMRSRGIKHLWVDKECIQSGDSHERQQALQCMDMVYSASDHPLAVLSVPIRTRTELKILQDLLENQHNDVEECCNAILEGRLEEDHIHRTLDLIYRLTSDLWWTRAWCFQEEYMAKKDMKLLLPHHLGEDVVPDTQTFGTLTQFGELTISSSQFRRRTTRLILGYVMAAKRIGKRYDHSMCLQILSRAGDYSLIGRYGHFLDLEANGKAVSTLVLNDLQHKNYTIPSDMLNIAANCNVYYRTMNTSLIDVYKSSMSLALLTMWFLNGEIFWNGGFADPKRGREAWIEGQNVFRHLDSIAFDACPNIGEQSELAYRRKLRFLRPKLQLHGIETYGHLFRLTKIIKLKPGTVSTSDPAEVLLRIASEIQSIDATLSTRLTKFVTEEFRPGSAIWASRHAMSLSAMNLISRLRKNPHIGCGALVDGHDGSTNGEVDAGIFAIDDPEPKPSSSPYVFTSWQCGSRGTPWYKNQPEEDKYVSLKVSTSESGRGGDGELLLRTEAWVDGLCFYEGATQRPYVFPWPEYFYASAGRGRGPR